VVAEEGSGEWTLTKPLELRAGAFAPAIYKDLPRGVPVKEKNWMPFVHDDRLHVTYSVAPHRVFEMNSSGHAVREHVTRADALLAPFAGEDVHGGPPVVRVSRPGRAPYYLGVLHFFKVRARACLCVGREVVGCFFGFFWVFLACLWLGGERGQTGGV
jgi:hypothetical protein